MNPSSLPSGCSPITPAVLERDRARGFRRPLLAAAMAALLLVLAGCGTGAMRTMLPLSIALTLVGGETTIDTNCTGCNGTRAGGGAVYRITAMQADGGPADVAWTLSGGDAKAGAGSISSAGEYTPPGFLTADRVEVTLTAQLKSDPSTTATTHLSITPGFLEP